MKKNGFNLFHMALEKYKKEAQKAGERNDKEALKEAKWKIKYFKDKIKRKKVLKND